MLNPIELGVIMAVAVLVFGPKKIPEIANSLGRSIMEFKKGASDLEAKLRQEADPGAVAIAPPAPPVVDPLSSYTREEVEAQMRREIEEKVRRELEAERQAPRVDPSRPAS